MLVARAKKLYFDKNSKIKHVFVDAFGRFSYNKGNLLEINSITKAEVFKIDKNSIKSINTSEVNDFSNEDTIKKVFGKKVDEKTIQKK